MCIFGQLKQNALEVKQKQQAYKQKQKKKKKKGSCCVTWLTCSTELKIWDYI